MTLQRLLFLALLLWSGSGVSGAWAADLDVAIPFSEPGVYGRIDIGRYPKPQLVVSTPVIAEPVPAQGLEQPIYLWVPPEHQQHWSEHCRTYHACSHPVYFIEHDWYKQYVLAPPQHREVDHQTGRDREERDRSDHERDRE